MKTAPKAHPAAELFPMMTPDELTELAGDIKTRGQSHPAVVHEGMILDGRNRATACRLAGVELATVDWRTLPGVNATTSPTAWVLSTNLHRRHLNESQRALIAAESLPMLEAEARTRMAAGGRSKGVPRGTPLPEAITKIDQARVTAEKKKPLRSAEQAAKATGASARQVARAKVVVAARPDLAQLVREGKASLKQVEKKIRHAEQVKQIKAYVPPVGRFSVITTDFSWTYRDQLDGSDAVRGAPPYPPMSVPEIVDFVHGPLARAAEDVCLYGCWVTNPILLDLDTWPIVQRAIQAEGFRPVKLETWRKIEESGKDFTGLGNGVRNDTEQLVLFARGRVVYNELGAAHGRPVQRTCFDAPIGDHSEKPQLAYDRLEQLVPYAARLEMFARAPREGWVTSGAELPKPSRGAVEKPIEPPAPPSPPPAPAKKGRKLKIRDVEPEAGA